MSIPGFKGIYIPGHFAEFYWVCIYSGKNFLFTRYCLIKCKVHSTSLFVWKSNQWWEKLSDICITPNIWLNEVNNISFRFVNYCSKKRFRNLASHCIQFRSSLQDKGLRIKSWCHYAKTPARVTSRINSGNPPTSDQSINDKVQKSYYLLKLAFVM